MAATNVPFSTAMTRLGLGYESSSGRVKASPFAEEPEPQTVVFHQPADYEDGPSQTAVQYKMNLIESSSDLEDKLDIKGKFALRKGNISGSIGGGYLDTEVKTNEKVYILITCEVVHSVTSIAGEPKMAPEGVPGNARATSTLTEDKFLDLYGDSFVSAIVVGGRLDGLVEITAESDEDVTKIRAEGQAEVKNVASGQISVNYVVSKLTAGRQATVTVNAVGGGIGLSPMDAPSFVALARVFPIMVNGGDSETLEFEVQREVAEDAAEDAEGDGEEPDPEKPENDFPPTPELIQVLKKKNVKFPGIAVPVRAIVRNYKSLPIFSSSETTLTRLSNYILEDLLEYYLTYDNSKNTVADLMQNDNDLLSLTDLESLDGIRKDVRASQVEILAELVALQAITDGQKVATSVVNYMASLLPGEYHLFQVKKVVSGAERAKEDERLAILAENARQQQRQQQVLQEMEAFRTNVVTIMKNGVSVQLFDDDSIRIYDNSGVGIRSLDSSPHLKVLPWKNPEGAQTLSDFPALSPDAVWQAVRDIGDKNAREILMHRQRFLAGRLQRGEISMEEFLEELETERESLNQDLDTYVAKALDSGIGGEITEAGAELYSAFSGVGELLRIDVVDAAQGLVRLRTQSGKFWRHKLQVFRYGVIVAEELGDGSDDVSFTFRIVSVGNAVTLEPDAGTRGWKLYVLKGEDGLPPLLVGAPVTADVNSDLRRRLQDSYFTIDLVSAEKLIRANEG